MGALSVLLLAKESFFERSMLCVWGVICLNNACDFNCVCSFRMSFLCVFVCLYISNCSRAVSYTHLDVYKRQPVEYVYKIINQLSVKLHSDRTAN